MPEASGAARAPASGGGSGITGRHITLSLVLTTVLVLALVGLDFVTLAASNPQALFSRHYYLALGDSISFGYQPDLNFTSGFVDDLFSDLHQANVTDLVNYACAGETTTTMIQGNCSVRLIHHDAYLGAQLDAAVAFLHAHPGRVNPITLDIGSNDVLPDFNTGTCGAVPQATTDLATMDTNLTGTILPRLIAAVGTPYRTGDIVMLNYYNPFAKECPDSATFVHQLNDHLASDAARFGIPLVDVYSAFGGDAHMADNICTYTWMCDARYHDFHPTSAGYAKIKDAVESVLAYPGIGPNARPAPLIPFFGELAPADPPRRAL